MKHKLRGPSMVEGIIRKWFWKWLAIDRLWRQTELAMMGVDDIQKQLNGHIEQHIDFGPQMNKTPSFPHPARLQDEGGETLGTPRTD